MSLRDAPIVCFSSNDWSDIPSSKSHIMRHLARTRPVLFVETIGIHTPQLRGRDLRRIGEKVRKITRGVRRVDERLYVWSPPALPFHGRRAARLFNRVVLTFLLRRLLHRLRIDDAIVWSYLPNTADVVERLPARRRVYHCIDDYASFSDTPREIFQQLERKLAGLCDLTVVSARPLYEELESSARRIAYVPHGVDTAAIERALLNPSVPAELQELRRPLAGFVGRVADWVDLDLVARCADELPEWTFVLVGPANVELVMRPNIVWLGRKEHEEVPRYIREFDVCLIPFARNRLTQAINPLKLYEYLAVGKPVVSVPLPEVERFGGLVTTVAPEDFPAAILAARASDNETLAAARRESVRRQGWDDVATQILNELEAAA